MDYIKKKQSNYIFTYAFCGEVIFQVAILSRFEPAKSILCSGMILCYMCPKFLSNSGHDWLYFVPSSGDTMSFIVGENSRVLSYQAMVSAYYDTLGFNSSVFLF